ncbi:MAG: ACT domain-containing protein [Candidatus Omnitrophica bacterium]|nr:ACT domain-containing protein [Candidatus Omnitrophota bacterium]
MKKVMITVLGADRPGIVADVTGVLLQAGCNLEDSSMTILEGEFAMLVVVSLEAKLSVAALKKCLASFCKKSKLDMTVKPFQEPLCTLTVVPPKNYVISVIGADRPGIVHHVSKLLASREINITDVETKKIGKGERVVYAMILEAGIPINVPIPKLEEALEELGNKLSVEITIKPIESLTL